MPFLDADVGADPPARLRPTACPMGKSLIEPAASWGTRWLRSNTSATQSGRCRRSIGSRWRASSQNYRLDESWYWEYWFEKDHSPDLAFLIARRVRSFLRWLLALSRSLRMVAKAADAVDERPIEAGRQWRPIRPYVSTSRDTLRLRTSGRASICLKGNTLRRGNRL
jgi:hypothetical protein